VCCFKENEKYEDIRMDAAGIKNIFKKQDAFLGDANIK
jgi:hypothetical protein